jgi:phage terminase Nu1 subunit (DNA packaging protein)
MKRVAAGWQSQEGDDLIAEKARLAANQADHVALLVAHKRGEVVPIPAMGEALNFLSATIRAKLLALPARYRSLAPGVSITQYTILDGLIREILSELAAERFPPVVRRMAEQYFSELSAAAKTNGQPVGGPIPDVEPGGERGGG